MKKWFCGIQERTTNIAVNMTEGFYGIYKKKTTCLTEKYLLSPTNINIINATILHKWKFHFLDPTFLEVKSEMVLHNIQRYTSMLRT